VWIANDDIGFVQPDQAVKVKVATYPFQKYGLLAGKILTVSADSTDTNSNGQKTDGQPRPGTTSNYRALVALDRQYLVKDGKRYTLSPGMSISGEIALGDRTVLDYLLSPIQKTTLEAARER
jgi:HlyD family secretion protein